jgi:hypothetical protein
MGIFSSIFGGKSQIKAAKENKKDLKEAKALSLAGYQPYVDAGNSALTAYLNSIGQGDSNAAMAAFEASPAYQLNYATAIDEGRRGVQDTAQAEGSYNSGRTLKALQDRAQETSRGFFSDYMKGLSGVADMGYNAAGATAGIRGDYATGINNARTGVADAKTSQYAGFDNLLSGGLKFLSGQGYLDKTPTSLY